MISNRTSRPEGDYEIVAGSTSDLTTFRNNVKNLIAQGYTPLGGLAVSGTSIYQAMFRNNQLGLTTTITEITSINDFYPPFTGPR